MPDTLNSLFEQLLATLQTAEKRHRTAYGSASDNNEWDIADRESAAALCITNWRRTIATLQAEIIASDMIADPDIAEITPPSGAEVVAKLQQGTDSPSQADDERIGRYVWQKMCELSAKKHVFSDRELADLQDAKWCGQVLNLPAQFFLLTTKEVKYYWKRDVFVFNGMKFRLCMLWYNDLYRGRSQRECFDLWYDSLGLREVSISGDDDHLDLKTEDDTNDIKVGRYICNKLRELGRDGFVFTNDQIIEMCSLEWSRRTFSYNRILSFAKVFDDSKGISEQTKDERGYSRYWEEIFLFGTSKLLIMSQWYAKDKASFDAWFDLLVNMGQMQNGIRSETAPFNESQPGSAITGAKPVSLQLFGRIYTVKNWNDLYLRVCEILVLHCPYMMASLDKDTELNSERRINFSYIQSEIRYNRKRLSNGLWIETNKNSMDVVKVCRKLLEKCEISSDELHVETAED